MLLGGFPCGSAGKESACNAGDLGLIPGLGRSLGEGKSCPLQYSGLENSRDWVTKSRTRLSHFAFPFCLFLDRRPMGEWLEDSAPFGLPSYFLGKDI